MPDIQYNGIFLSLPSGWQDGTQVIALGPPVGEFRPNLVVSQETTSATESAETFAARQLPVLKQALGGYALVKDAPASFGELKGILREHSFKSGNVKLAQLQFYVVNGGTAFTFTFTDSANGLTTSRKMAEQLFGGVKLSGGGGGGGGRTPATPGGGRKDGFF